MSPFRTFEEDASADRDVALLRLLAAVVVLAAGAWLVVRTPAGWTGAIAALAVLVAAFWLARSARTIRRRARQRLVLSESGIATLDQEVPWSAVTSIDVDEDLLVVRIRRTGGDPIAIEPFSEGVSVYVLADAIRAARAAADALPDRSGGAPGTRPA